MSGGVQTSAFNPGLRAMIECGMVRPKVYRGWHISYDPPPIPDRRFDWRAVHDEYDAWNDGDGWCDNGLKCEAANYLELIGVIDEAESERAAA